MKRLLSFVLITMFLTACNSTQPAPAMSTVSQTPTASETATATQTPTPEATAITEPTATPEVKQFPICQTENFHDCLISMDDLQNGNYLKWLYTISEPFDQGKIKKVPLVDTGKMIIYNPGTVPNFTDHSTTPFHRDRTAGYAVLNVNGEKHQYIVMPIEFFDPAHPTQNQWIITVSAPYYPGHFYTQGELQAAVKIWRE